MLYRKPWAHGLFWGDNPETDSGDYSVIGGFSRPLGGAYFLHCCFVFVFDLLLLLLLFWNRFLQCFPGWP